MLNVIETGAITFGVVLAITGWVSFWMNAAFEWDWPRPQWLCLPMADAGGATIIVVVARLLSLWLYIS